MIPYQKLPADPTSLILGIIALVITIAGCCCGLFTIVSITLAIVGLVQAQKSLKLFAFESENYNPKSREIVNTAKIISIIALCLSGIVLVGQIAYFAIVGATLGPKVWEEFDNERNRNTTETTYQTEQDSIIIDSTTVDSNSVN